MNFSFTKCIFIDSKRTPFYLFPKFDILGNYLNILWFNLDIFINLNLPNFIHRYSEKKFWEQFWNKQDKKDMEKTCVVCNPNIFFLYEKNNQYHYHKVEPGEVGYIHWRKDELDKS